MLSVDRLMNQQLQNTVKISMSFTHINLRNKKTENCSTLKPTSPGSRLREDSV